MKKIYQHIIKRFFDILATLIGLISVCPLLLILIILLFIVNNGKPFFSQTRIGRDGYPFTILKLKTMNDKIDKNGNLLAAMERVTTVGNFCRKYSLDELPQLLNVLKGDMSMVGPRPLLPDYLQLYNSHQIRRHEVLPGITGWAQVNGRNTISWEEKFEYDVFYVDNQSFALDFKIILLTIKKVINKSDINNSEDIDMPIFKGSNESDNI